MASKFAKPYTEENTNYARISRIVVELCRDVLWDFLTSEIKPSDLATTVVQNLHKLELHDDIKDKFNDYKSRNILPKSDDLDCTALYCLIRNLLPKSKLKPPAKGWGVPPDSHQIKVADDVERLRGYRNKLYSHSKLAAIPNVDYQIYVTNMKALLKRFDTRLKTNYNKVLDNYLSCVMDPVTVDEYKDLLMTQTETRSMIVEMKDDTKKLNQKVDFMKDDVESMKGGIEQLISSNDDTVERLNEIEEWHDGIQNRFDKQTESHENLKQDMRFLENRVKQNRKTHSGMPNIEINVTPTLHIHGDEATHKEECADSNEETYSESGESQAPRRISKTFSEVVGHAQKRQHKEEGFNKVTHEINVKVSPLPPSDPLPASTKARLDVLHKAVNGFRDGHFVLVCAEVERQKYIESIALAPWTVVFDLDPNSRTSGLLSAVKEKLCSLRSLYVQSLFEKTTNFTECSTHWYSVRSHASCDTPISKEFASWKKNPVVIQGLKNVIKNMESFSDVYTRFRVLILWPPDEITSRYMNHILSKLEKHFMPEMAVIDNSLMKSQDSISFLRHYMDDLGERLSLVQLSMEHVCNYIRRSCFTEAKNQQGKFVLPVSDVAIDCQIDQREASWLREVLEILYEDKQYNDSEIMPKDLLKELDNFYRGGTLPWLVRYELGAGSVDTERDLMGPIIMQIKKMKDLYKSGIIRINHAPGSGGTTLAQRVLWQCRRELPCAQVNLREGYMIGELEQRLVFLYKKTDLPLLILFDGEDEQRVEELVKSLERISLIVLFVKRYPYRIKKTEFLEDQFWLNSYVSQKESSVIAVKLLERCNDERKRENINKLGDTVKMGRQVAIFEFGLAAYAHEYTGISSYVSGFLRLDQTKDEMSPWQKALAMLSFTYYYGQIGLSCQFFTDILQLGTQRVPTIDDFPNEMQSLIVPETSKKQNLIRISHHFIAKEILEQVLPWPKTKSDVRKEQLHIEDKKDLENFAIMFIEEAEKIDGKKHSPAIISMLTKSFISRDNPVDELKRQKGKNKNLLSPLLSDLKYKQPFTPCFNVLIRLTHSFPNEDHFHAHLGRLYSILIPEKEKEAEEEFRTALELCENRMGKQELEDLPKLLRRNLMTTNHMYGKMFQSRAEKFIEGNTLNKTRLANMMENTYQLLENVKCACERFQLCRFYNPGKTDDKRILEAELSVRLRFGDFISMKCPSENAIKFIEDNEEVECYREICDFLKDCILEIDCLFTDYFSSLSESEDIDESFVKHQRGYKALFKKSSPGYVTRQGDSIQSRRLHIAGMKIKSWTSDGYGDLLQIDNLDEITDIIRLYESNFKDNHKRGKQCSKKALDMDYMEWLVAIRHKKIPNPKGIEEVLQVVETWNETLKTPSSRLYLFILKSILGFGSSGCQGNTKLLTEALELKTKLSNQATYIPNSRRPREWFGKGKGIRCLELGSRYGGQKDRFINFMDLALFKGVIIGPNTNRRSGSIRVDVSRSVDVIAFFVPLKAKMEGAIFAGRRVEFGIGFSFLNGYEAFSVKQLKKVKCPKCGLDNEATSRDTEIQCSKPCEYKFRIP